MSISSNMRLQDTADSWECHTVCGPDITKYIDWLRQCSYAPGNQHADMFMVSSADEHTSSSHCTGTPLYQDAGSPDRIGPSGKSVENSTKLTCLEITGYRIKYSTVLWLLELRQAL